MMYLKDIDGHVPLTAVADEIGRQESHQPVIKWPVGGLDDKLEVIVSLVQLVPEEQVRLYTQQGSVSSSDQTGVPGP